MRRSRGFTLIEIAVVLGIVLIIISLGLTAISSQLSSASYSITKKRQDAIKEALIAYLGANKRLPCPFVPAGVAVTGIAPNQNAGPPPACPQVFGAVPFATLGLAREVGEDGWGNLFSYGVYSVPVLNSCPGAGIDWANSTCFGAGKTGGLTVKDGTVVTSTNLATSVVAVVISHGVNGLGAWVAAQGTRNAPPLTCEEAQNAVGITWPASCAAAYTANVFYKGESQANDDVVAYLTATDLLQPLTKQGTILSATAQVNVDLQTLVEQAIALNTASATCGNPPSLGADPWGYTYANSTTLGLGIDPAFCFYTTGGVTGVATAGAAGGPATTACACASPTICRAVSSATIGTYRNRATNAVPACP